MIKRKLPWILLVAIFLMGANTENGKLIIDSSSDPTIRHIPKFVGEIWFVNGAVASSGDGMSPDGAFKTITEATTASSAGDTITVAASTYVENVVMSKNSVELWCEIGTVIDPAANVGITVSGDSCRIKGEVKVTPNAAVGVLVSGDECVLSDVKVVGGSHNFHIAGIGTIMHRCAAAYPSVGNSAYYIQGMQTRLNDCSTVGNAATYGYHINGGADTGVLRNCTSADHTTSGFYIDTGSQDWTLLGCSSGSNDGKWRDIDTANVWSDFSYDRFLFATSTFNGGTTYNIFKVTGAVRMYNIFGHVTTATPATNSTINLELYSANNSEDITDSAGAPDIVSRVVGTTLAREEPASEPFLLEEPDNTPAIVESANYRDPKVPLILIEDDAADTYVQVVLSDAVASGAIHWHIEWEPVSDDGFVEAQ